MKPVHEAIDLYHEVKKVIDLEASWDIRIQVGNGTTGMLMRSRLLTAITAGIKAS